MKEECDHILGLYEVKDTISGERALLTESKKKTLHRLLNSLYEFKYCPECGEKLDEK